VASDEKKRNRIMDFAFSKFNAVGISQVTMDDIAKGVGMGKGTLYKYFPSKEYLILQTIDYFTGFVERNIEKILADDELTTVQKLNTFLRSVAGQLAKMNPSALEYMERSMPAAYEKITEARERIMLNNLLRLLEEGKKSGLFNPQMDERLVTHMMIASVNHMIHYNVMEDMGFTFDKLFTSIVTVMLRGCLSEEGRRLEY
jgi:AcrR family transcriptional regulator